MAGSLLALGGLCVGMGRRRRAAPASDLPVRNSKLPSAHAPGGVLRGRRPARVPAALRRRCKGFAVIGKTVIVPFPVRRKGDRCPRSWSWPGRLGAALVLGGAIGLERELTGQVAGLRTHMSVALGAALFGIVSAYGWNEFAAVRAQTNVQVDVTRVASNIVTGVGFLGGGAILKDGATVRGLTTAASLWVTAAVGWPLLWVYSLAAVTTIGLVFSLILLRGPRGWIRRRSRSKGRAHGVAGVDVHSEGASMSESPRLSDRATTSVLVAVALVGGCDPAAG